MSNQLEIQQMIPWYGDQRKIDGFLKVVENTFGDVEWYRRVAVFSFNGQHVPACASEPRTLKIMLWATPDVKEDPDKPGLLLCEPFGIKPGMPNSKLLCPRDVEQKGMPIRDERNRNVAVYFPTGSLYILGDLTTSGNGADLEIFTRIMTKFKMLKKECVTPPPKHPWPRYELVEGREGVGTSSRLADVQLDLLKQKYRNIPEKVLVQIIDQHETAKLHPAWMSVFANKKTGKYLIFSTFSKSELQSQMEAVLEQMGDLVKPLHVFYMGDPMKWNMRIGIRVSVEDKDKI